MNVNEVGDNFNCDCGFSWRRGQSGSHSCGDGLRKQIAELKAQRDELASENAALLDFDIDEFRDAGPYQPDDSILGKMKTPATTAYLNSVRAEGVKILADRMQQTIDNAKLNSDEIGALAGAIFTGAAIAAQLRAGKDGE